jgi:Zn/Cd-binding protein ZinT
VANNQEVQDTNEQGTGISDAFPSSKERKLSDFKLFWESIYPNTADFGPHIYSIIYRIALKYTQEFAVISNTSFFTILSKVRANLRISKFYTIRHYKTK